MKFLEKLKGWFSTPEPAKPTSVPSVARSASFDECLPLLLKFEGGKDDDPYDPGGRTAYGIIQREYDVWNRQRGLPQKDVWLISPAEVKAIYKASYWDKLACDHLPRGSAFALFDYGVNSGLAQAARDAQRVCGITVDGRYGNQTLNAIKNTDPEKFVRGLYARRMILLRSLKTWWRFGKGWTRRCDEGLAFCLKQIKQ